MKKIRNDLRKASHLRIEIYLHKQNVMIGFFIKYMKKLHVKKIIYKSILFLSVTKHGSVSRVKDFKVKSTE